MFANATVPCPGRSMLGETFHPCPNSRAGTAPVPSVAIPALPLLPWKFSALIDRVCAAESRHRFPSDIPSPLKAVSIFIDSLDAGGLDGFDQLALEHEEENKRRQSHNHRCSHDVVPCCGILALKTRD